MKLSKLSERVAILRSYHNKINDFLNCHDVPPDLPASFLETVTVKPTYLFPPVAYRGDFTIRDSPRPQLHLDGHLSDRETYPRLIARGLLRVEEAERFAVHIGMRPSCRCLVPVHRDATVTQFVNYCTATAGCTECARFARMQGDPIPYGSCVQPFFFFVVQVNINVTVYTRWTQGNGTGTFENITPTYPVHRSLFLFLQCVLFSTMPRLINSFREMSSFSNRFVPTLLSA